MFGLFAVGMNGTAAKELSARFRPEDLRPALADADPLAERCAFTQRPPLFRTCTVPLIARRSSSRVTSHVSRRGKGSRPAKGASDSQKRMNAIPVEPVLVAGDDIRLFWHDRPRRTARGVSQRQPEFDDCIEQPPFRPFRPRPSGAVRFDGDFRHHCRVTATQAKLVMVVLARSVAADQIAVRAGFQAR